MTSRTIISLEADQLDALRQRAHEERVSMTALVRRLVREFLDRGRRHAAAPDVYARIVGIGRSGVHDIAEQHDRRLAAALSRAHRVAPKGGSRRASKRS